MKNQYCLKLIKSKENYNLVHAPLYWYNINKSTWIIHRFFIISKIKWNTETERRINKYRRKKVLQQASSFLSPPPASCTTQAKEDEGEEKKKLKQKITIFFCIPSVDMWQWWLLCIKRRVCFLSVNSPC